MNPHEATQQPAPVDRQVRQTFDPYRRQDVRGTEDYATDNLRHALDLGPVVPSPIPPWDEQEQRRRQRFKDALKRKLKKARQQRQRRKRERMKRQ